MRVITRQQILYGINFNLLSVDAYSGDNHM